MYLNSSMYVRSIALVSLLVGLVDAYRMLGVGDGGASPMTALGLTGFAYLGILSLARLFAAVGLWMKASWGGVVLVVSTSWELALFLTGSPDIHIGLLAFGIRVVLLAAVLVMVLMNIRERRAVAHD